MSGANLSRKVHSLMQAAIRAGKFPGAVLLVAHDTHLLFHESFGCATWIPTAEPMRRETLFDLASLTKVVATTTALMLLYNQQRFDLDDRVGEYLPWFAQQGKGAITIRHLLTHSSGLPGWLPLYQAFPPSPSHDRREEFYALIARLPPSTPPGCRVQYSDLGFIILGALVEALSGMPLEQFCSEQIFTPLGLHSTEYREVKRPDAAEAIPSDAQQYAATEVCPWRRRLLRGEVHDENASAMGGVAGHAGLFATALDLFRFVSTLFRCLDKMSTFLSPHMILTFTQRQGIPSSSTWAVGWDTPSAEGSTAGRYFSAQSIGHTGFTGTSLWIDLARRVTVICLTNRVHPSRYRSHLKRFRPRLHDCIMEELLDRSRD